ncbi:MAG: NAD(P)H-dependent oxidoreductase subunit E [Calditrichia bacterium]
MKVTFSEAALQEYNKIVQKYPEKRAALLPALHLAQREFGWISRDVIRYLSELMDIPSTEILDTTTFYTMFKTAPTGKYHIQVCGTISCALRGSRQIYEHLSGKYGIQDGTVSADGRFSLMKVECLGSCGTAPVVQINDDYYEDLTIEKLDKILDGLS